MAGRCFRMISGSAGEAGPNHCPETPVWRGRFQARDGRWYTVDACEGHRGPLHIPRRPPLREIPLDHRPAQPLDFDTPSTHPTVQMRDETHMLRSRVPRIPLPPQLLGEPGCVPLQRSTKDRPQHLDHDALLSTNGETSVDQLTRLCRPHYHRFPALQGIHQPHRHNPSIGIMLSEPARQGPKARPGRGQGRLLADLRRHHRRPWRAGRRRSPPPGRDLRPPLPRPLPRSGRVPDRHPARADLLPALPPRALDQDPPHQPDRADLRRDPPACQGDRPAARRALLPEPGVGGAGPGLAWLAWSDHDPAAVRLLQELRRQLHHPSQLEEVVDQPVTPAA